MSVNQKSKKDSTLNNFVTTSTIHGVSHIGRVSEFSRRIFWVLALVICCLALFWQLSALIGRYASSSKQTNMQIIFGAQPFPAVTLCSLNPIKKSLAKSVPELEELFFLVESVSEHGYDNKTAKYAQEKLAINSSMDGMEIQKKAEEYLIHILHSLDPAIIDQLTFKFDDIFKSCAFDGESCGESDFVAFMDMTYGQCYSFNYNKTSVKLSSRAGPNYGLRLFVVSNLSEYIITTTAAGIRLVGLFPFPDTFGYNLPSNSANSVGIRPNRNQRYNDRGSECNDVSEQEYFYDGDYTVEGCQRSCFQNAALRRCNCIDPKYPAPRGAISCPLNDSLALDCLHIVEKEERCLCPMRCTEPSFDVTISSSTWRVEAGRAVCKESNCDQILPSAMLINLFYEHLNQQVFTQSPSYTLINLMSDTAGQLGFWIGLSFVGFLEIVVFLYAMGRNLILRARLIYRKLRAPTLPPVVLPPIRPVDTKISSKNHIPQNP